MNNLNTVTVKSMFSIVYLESIDGRLEIEEQAVKDELERLGNTNITIASRKKLLQYISQKKYSNVFVAGSIQLVRPSLKILKCKLPPPNDYPLCLKEYFHRNIWKSNIKTLRSHFYDSATEIFAKPYDRKKSFTGRVFRSSEDLIYLNGVGNNTKIYCSPVVNWVSECRFYIKKGHIIGKSHYDGDKDKLVDMNVIHTAIQIYEDSGEAVSTYIMDFGVLDNDNTALVEVNDAYSVGLYDGMDPQLYADLIITRWVELTS